jgi:hypothetical protein
MAGNPRTITQEVTVSSMSSFSGDTKLVYEAGFGQALGIWDAYSTQSFKTGCSVTSTSFAQGSSMKITFTANVDDATLGSAAMPAASALQGTPGNLVTAITTAQSSLGKSAVSIPAAASLTIGAASETGLVTQPPTPAPTLSATGQQELKAAQEQANELHTKSGELSELQQKRQQAADAIENARARYTSSVRDAMRTFNKTKEDLNGTLTDVMLETNRSSDKYETAVDEFNLAQTSFNDIGTEASNTAYGKLPEHAAQQGFLKLQDNAARQQHIFLKFPTTQLKDGDTIMDAHLRMFKYGGEGGPVRVYTSSCQWTRGKITFTTSQNLAFERVSRGTDAVIPDDTGVWTKIELKGDAVERARVQGNDLCLSVQGGPSVNPAVISSELTTQAPQLMIQIKQDGLKLQYGALKNKYRAVDKGPKYDVQAETDKCRARIKQEITSEYTKNLLAQNKKAAAAKIQEVTMAAGAQMNAEDVQSVLTMEVDSTKTAGNLVDGESAAIKKQIRVVVSKQLTAMANKGATADEINSATAKLKTKAVQDAAAAAAAAGGNIQNNVNNGLGEAEEKLQRDNEIEKQLLIEKKKDIAEAANKLTPMQEAKLAQDVLIELQKRAVVCVPTAAASDAAAEEAAATAPPTPSPTASRLELAAEEEATVRLLE